MVVISDRLKGTTTSKTTEARQRARALRDQGVDVINMAAGELVAPLSSEIAAAAHGALKENCHLYTETAGLRKLRELIVARVAYLRAFAYEPEELIVTGGAKAALFLSMVALLNSDDEVILPSPYWSTFAAQARLVGARVREVRLNPPAYELTSALIGEAITPRTKMIIMNSPANPTGRIWPEPSVLEVVRLAQKHNLWIVWDASYADLLFDRRNPSTLVGTPAGARERLIIVGSFSKSHGIAGWRLGYAAAPAEIIRAMTAVQSHASSNANSFAQHTMIEVLSGSEKIVDRTCAELQRRRDAIWPRLETLSILNPIRPDGGLYVYCDVNPRDYCAARFITSCSIDAVATDLLENAGVAVTPGSAFAQSNGLRISLSIPEPQLLEGLTRFERLLNT